MWTAISFVSAENRSHLPFLLAKGAQEPRQSGVVLLADSDTSRCASLEQRLRREGYAVRSVRDGAAALEDVRDRTVDVVLADAGLSHLDELRAGLRGTGARSGIPLVLLTSKVQEDIEADD